MTLLLSRFVLAVSTYSVLLASYHLNGDTLLFFYYFLLSYY